MEINQAEVKETDEEDNQASGIEKTTERVVGSNDDEDEDSIGVPGTRQIVPATPTATPDAKALADTGLTNYNSSDFDPLLWCKDEDAGGNKKHKGHEDIKFLTNIGERPL